MESPEDIGIVPNLLGQSSDRMRDKHYDRADRVHARLRYRDLRERSRQQARRSRLRRKIRRAA
jgi:Tfp pilus assembly protein PilF